VQGVATAAGCQLVAACDLAVAGEAATFATPGVKIGLFCTTPMVPLVRAIPAKPAMEMLLTGEPISARRALELGLVNRVVPDADLDLTIKSFTDTIIGMSPLVIRMGKKAFYEIQQLKEPDAYDRAVPIMTENALCHDAQEGIAAFLQKRPPRWSGT
jgi:enoyl-CoA hydratase/carnithine racemase